MATYPDAKVLPVAQLLMGCLAEAVLDNPKPPGIVGFRTGTDGQPLAAQSTDECCLGAAFVRVIRTYPSWSAPTPATTSVACAQPMAAEMEISMWRCAPIGTLQAVPTQAVWDEMNTDLLNDRATIMQAICCFIKLRDSKSVMYGDWDAVSTEGGCAGSRVTIQVDLYGSSR